MINVNNLKTGQTIELDGNIFSVIEFQHVKPGKGQAFVRSKLRNLRSGAVIEHTFNAGIKVKKAHIEKTKMQYLYGMGDEHVFMNMETYDQISLQTAQISHELKFMIENMEIDMIVFQGEVLGVILPDKVVLEVIETPPGVKGDTASNATKDAKVQTGLNVKVPLFITEGEKIIVSTQDGKYVSRA